MGPCSETGPQFPGLSVVRNAQERARVVCGNAKAVAEIAGQSPCPLMICFAIALGRVTRMPTDPNSDLVH